MQLNTANKLHPLEHPATLICSEESTQNIDPTTVKQWLPQKAFSKVIRALIHFLLVLPASLSVRFKLWTAANIVKHQLNSSEHAVNWHEGTGCYSLTVTVDAEIY